jgi:competence protein ComEA
VVSGAPRRRSVAIVIDLTRAQLAGWALAGVFVLLLGARYLRAGTAGGHERAGARGGGGSQIRLHPAGGGTAIVDVTGAVRRPGVYRLRADQRVQDAVRRAGGLTRAAAPAAINLAAKVADGAQILVPSRRAAAVGEGGAWSTPAASPGPVNLNTATAEQLDQLDGIGPTTARKILEYRRAHGGFGSLQDLDRIPGIGPKRLAALRGKVTV